jgi:biopolymer transport protein ExbB/TolQ
MERQRAFINGLITAFPAIGLMATLHGLIVALSHASGIVSGNEAERLGATDIVTNTLSSSFATTLIALIAMAVATLINIREEHAEADLVDDTNKRLLAVFWPGRK